MTRRVRTESRKTPRQARASTTVEVVLQAAAHILERQGLAGFTTNAIAAKAGVSIGSLYQYFPSKEAILARLTSDLLARDRALFAERLAQTEGLSLEARAEAFVGAMLDAHDVERGLRAVLYESYPAVRRGDEVRALQALVIETSAALFASDPTFVASGRDPRAVAAALFFAVNGVMHAWARPDPPFDRAAVREEIVQLARTLVTRPARRDGA